MGGPRLPARKASRPSCCSGSRQHRLPSSPRPRWDAVDVDARAVRRYRDIIDNYLVPSLGRHRLGELAPHHIAAVYGGLLGRGLAPKTVQLTHTVLHRALSQAVRWETLSRNVASLVDVPRVPRVEAPSFSPAQLARLRAVVRGDRLEALFVLAMLTGMRRGELLALPRYAER